MSLTLFKKKQTNPTRSPLYHHPKQPKQRCLSLSQTHFQK
ncbi:hypothetical protein BTHERMOSOX_1453 [Bathymodiolus thermophilus thioautotrophic gill symbiont]|uniref:Uncharacterized protein n=1 Tax=Bathymodiolus thermophilus thioautotrophic gill symbiont TaxID=2360 RepID=A0A8H8XAE8_9GAMM|nr:hypothetical protein THERMOS_290 [Bathymodiolus thermophilus thioautotrophic gill symbiont]SGZ86001.1 hypothetical protein BTHERMOSOX_1453 [Bathymodiolus thermophilus thioautotrophic gill symbiont]